MLDALLVKIKLTHSFELFLRGGKRKRTMKRGERRTENRRGEEREKKESEPKRGGIPRLLSGDFLFPR